MSFWARGDAFLEKCVLPLVSGIELGLKHLFFSPQNAGISSSCKLKRPSKSLCWAEVGLEGIKKFESAKQFTAWLRLAPNNKFSGGKVLSHHLPKGSSRLKIAFRNTANAIGNLKEGWLVDFFKRINYKKGRATAVSALARKLAVIIWNMIAKGQNYNPPTQYLFLDEKRKIGIIKRIKKQITKFDLTNEDLEILTN